MAYLWIKWAHIVSSTILFGTGIGIAFFKWYADRTEAPAAQAAVLRIVVKADWFFTAPAVVTQLATGLYLASIGGWSLTQSWLRWALMLYATAGVCWLPVLWLQIAMRKLAEVAAMESAPLPLAYHRYRRLWTALGVPAFVALIAVFYLMVFKPA